MLALFGSFIADWFVDFVNAVSDHAHYRNEISGSKQDAIEVKESCAVECRQECIRGIHDQIDR